MTSSAGSARAGGEPVAVEEKSVRAADGTRLHMHRWAPAGSSVKAELLVVHGYLEHGARYREFAHALAGHGIAVSAVDLRGHGRSEGSRGFVRTYEDWNLDVDAALATLPSGAPHFLLGHSNGALISLNYVSARRPRLKGLLLTNPYLEIAVKVPAYKLALGEIAARVYPRLQIPTGLPSSGLSRDPAVGEAYDRDPLVLKSAAAGWYFASLEAQARAKALTELPLPFLYIRSDADPVGLPEANRVLSERLQGADKTVLLRPGARHEVLNETDRHELFEIIADWILKRI